VLKVISDGEAIRNILGERDRYAFYLGAGASVDAGVVTAQEICERIRGELVSADAGLTAAADEDVERWANETLNWADTSRRYVTCIRRGYPNEARRVEYFRRILLGTRPSFCHHGVALLMSFGYVRPTCLTTNFDHLLEDAFVQQGIADCQPIRSDYECQYWENRGDRFYILKLHGDIDTLNVLNTREETIAISEAMYGLVETLAQGAGLIVLGTAGNEKSVRALFDDLGRRASGANTILSFGLLWGVYMGAPKPKAITSDELTRRVERRIEESEVNRDIVEMIADSRNELFCFFPVWSAGEFMLDLVKATGDKLLMGKAALRLDHEMRLRHTFASAGLSDDAVGRHLDSLRKQRRSLAARASTSRQEVDPILSGEAKTSSLELRVMYGDITSRSLMGADEFGSLRRAVVSPEDTLVSAGGGVAYQLLEKAGPDTILNELAKFGPIPRCTVAVTSGGALPVHYIFHAATIEIGQDGSYLVSEEDVTRTMVAVLEKASALDLGVVFVPLLGGGVASLGSNESYEGLLEGIVRWNTAARDTSRTSKLVVAVVIYQERQLPRGDAFQYAETVLGADFILRQSPGTPAAA
jgi:O-acetyl-ADP-ribose deacetylase (regulator of RNase III)